MAKLSQGLTIAALGDTIAGAPFSMGSLLDAPIPAVVFDTSAKDTHPQAANHRKINIVGPWEHPGDTFKGDVVKLTDKPYPSPINQDETLSPIDDIYKVATAGRHYIICPISLALNHQFSKWQIKSRAISFKGVPTFDIYFTYFSSSAGKQVPFAAINFVTPGAIAAGDWTGTIDTGPRKAIAHHLSAYATALKIDYVVAFDWQTLLLLKITATSGTTGSTGATTGTPTTTGTTTGTATTGATSGGSYDAKGVLLTDQLQKVKQHLYIFLRDAIANKLGGTAPVAG